MQVRPCTSVSENGASDQPNPPAGITGTARAPSYVCMFSGIDAAINAFGGSLTTLCWPGVKRAELEIVRSRRLEVCPSRKEAAAVRLMSATLGLFTLLPILANGQEKYEKFAIFITGLDSAAPVAESLIKLVNASKPFQAVGKNDDSKAVVLVSCMPRKQTDSFGCLYVIQYNGATFKTFFGAGLYVATTAEAVATNFLGSIAQDILERFEDTDKENMKQALETCLLLTDTKCNVPERLQKEVGAAQLTLSQYLFKKK